MSSELIEAPVEETSEESAAPGAGRSDPSIAFIASTIVWMIVLAAAVNSAYYVGDSQDMMGNPQALAMVAIALAALLVAMLAGLNYIVDRKRRRNRYPRGYRAPQPTRSTVPEMLATFVIAAYVAAVLAGAGWLGILIVERLGPSPNVLEVFDVIEAPMLGLLAAGFLFVIIIIPPAAMTPLLNRRHRRRYPDTRDHEGPGFTWTGRGMLFLNTVTMVLLILAVVRVPVA